MSFSKLVCARKFKSPVGMSYPTVYCVDLDKFLVSVAKLEQLLFSQVELEFLVA